jgi:hypothetical protein
MLIQVGEEQRVVGAGSAAILPRGLPHTFVILSLTARYLTLHTPAGFDEFVRAVSNLATGSGAPDRVALARTAAEHGIEILGPGLPLPERAADDHGLGISGHPAHPRAVDGS